MNLSLEDISQQQMDETPPSSPKPLFPFDAKVNKLIMQHMTGVDLLNLSEVSRNFCDYVDYNCMDKIQLVIHETLVKKLDVEPLLDSKRNYKHIRVTSLVYASTSMADIFDRFASSLVSVYSTYDFPLEPMSLLSVTTLKMVLGEGSGYREQGILSSVTNLKTLHLYGRHNYASELVNCLEHNSSLEELALEGHAQDSLFSSRRLPSFNMNLKCLKLDSTQFQDNSDENFERFLSRSTRLEELKVLRCNFTMFAKICNCAAFRVQHITFSPPYAHVAVHYQFEFNMNWDISYLGLILVNEGLVRVVLPKLPRLDTLYVSDPTPAMFKFIITHSPSLKNFRYAYFRDAYYDYDLVCSIYQKEVLTGNPMVPRNLIITQI